MSEMILLALRLARRAIRREPAVVVTAALTLALGLGATTTIYSTLHGFRRPLPVPQGEEVLQVRLSDLASGSERTVLSRNEIHRILAEQTAFASLGVFAVREVTCSGSELPPLRLRAAAMTAEVYEVLRTEPLRGRLPGSAGGESAPVALLSFSLWHNGFDADPDVVGRTILLDGQGTTIIGVMPEGFAFPYGQELWTPLDSPGPGVSGGVRGTGGELVGRLRENMSSDGAAAELAAIVSRAEEDGERPTTGVRSRVLGFTRDRAEGGEQIALLALLLIVGALMLLSCTNVSNILLSRSIGRTRELGVQAALGARPRNLIIQMLAESFLIAVPGGVSGLLLAVGAIRYIEGTLAANWGFYWMRISLDGSGVLFIGITLVVTALVAGTLPARRAARSDPGQILARGGSRRGGSRDGRLQRVMLGIQVASSVLALIASSFLATGLLAHRKTQLSFDADRIVLAGLTLEGERYGSPEARRVLFGSLPHLLTEQTEGAPAALTTGLPGFQSPAGRLEIEGVSRESDQPAAVMVSAVTEQAFAILGLEALSGRTFDSGDGPDAPVAVVSEGFVARHLSGTDPLLNRIRVAGVDGAGEWMQIVGVVPEEVQDMTSTARLEQVYVPLRQAAPENVYAMLGSGEAPAALAPRLRDALRLADPALPLAPSFLESPVFRAADMLAYAGQFTETAGILALLGSLGGLVVALVGIYGALSYYVSRRTRDLGIRIAVGADRREIIMVIIRRGWRQMAPGMAVGVLIAWLVSPLFGVFLGGVDPHNPAAYLGSVGFYFLISLAALLPPALRAAAVDPARVIREG